MLLLCAWCFCQRCRRGLRRNALRLFGFVHCNASFNPNAESTDECAALHVTPSGCPACGEDGGSGPGRGRLECHARRTKDARAPEAGTAFEVAGTGVAGTTPARLAPRSKLQQKGTYADTEGCGCGARPSRATAAAGYLAAAASADLSLIHI